MFVSGTKIESLLNAIKEPRKREVPALPDGTENLANMIIELPRPHDYEGMMALVVVTGANGFMELQARAHRPSKIKSEAHD